MDTQPLHPAHMLLGVTPESSGKGRTKVLIALISLTLVTANMIVQDMHIWRDSYRIIATKVKKSSRSRRPLRLFNPFAE